MDDVKRMTVKEFRELGGLQEINRRVLHPAGMAIEVVVDDETGEERFGGVWDYRDDPEGILYDDFAIDLKKTRAIDDLILQHDEARIKIMGQRIQDL